MAEVFRAKPFDAPDFQGYLALKRILPHLAEDDEFIMMFIDEAKLTVQLQHPNIVRIYELGQFQSSYYILMEYIAGRDVLTLQKRVRKRRETIGAEVSCFIAHEMARGLHYAHNQPDANGVPLNIIHRDVSPQNVLVDYLGQVKVIDFGIAKAAVQSTKTQIGVLKGKMGYMSPEQVQGLTLDARSDVFAIGTVLWEMLTNRRLFNGANEFETMQMVKEARVVPPSQKNPQISPEVDALVMKALTADRDDRYESAEAFADALQGWIQKQGTTPETLSLWMREVFAEELLEEIGKQEAFAKIQTPDDVRKIMFGEPEAAQEGEPEEPYEKTEIWAADIVPDEDVDVLEFAAQHTVVQAGGFDASQIQAQLLSASPPPLPERRLPPSLDEMETNERAMLQPSPPQRQATDSSFTSEGTNPRVAPQPKAGIGRYIAIGLGLMLFMAVCGVGTYIVAAEMMAPKTGGVLVTVSNMDAQVLVDGKPVAGSPARLEGLLVGDHLLEVSADGFEPFAQKLSVVEDTIQPVSVDLVSTTIEVAAVIRLPEAAEMRIYLDGEVRLPEEIQPKVTLGEGTHLLEVTAKGMRPWKKFIEIESRDQEPRVEVKLQPLAYSMTIDGEPRSVVRFDGKRVGTVPVPVENIDPFQIHRIEISLRNAGVSRWSGYFALPKIAQKKLDLSYDLPRKGYRKSDFGFITIDTGDTWFSVWIDGVDTGLITPIDAEKKLPLSVGTHTLSLRRGFDAHTQSIEVFRGETSVLRSKYEFVWEVEK